MEPNSPPPADDAQPNATPDSPPEQGADAAPADAGQGPETPDSGAPAADPPPADAPAAPSDAAAAPTSRWFTRTYKIVGGVFLFMVVAGVGSIELTSTSTFCGTTCHIMAPFYESWQKGSHTDVECVSCHIPPGTQSYMMAKLNGAGQVVDDLLNRTSTKPSAAVADTSCLRSGCHQREELGVPPASEDRSYKFDHQDHFDMKYLGIEVNCSTCHSHVQGDRHMQVNTNTCVTCHRSLGRIAPKEGEGHGEGTGEAPAGEADEPQVPPSACDACHDPPEEPFPYEGVTISHVEFQRQERACETCHQEAAQHPPPVNGGNCLACHVKRMGDEPVEVDEMHASHIGGEHKVECFSCHGLTDHRKETEVAGRFECTKCHISDKTHVVQRANYRRGGASLPGAEPYETRFNPMLVAHVDCTGCHTLVDGAVTRASAKGCDTCHPEGLGSRQVVNWQKSTHRLHDTVRAMLPPQETLAPDSPLREAYQLLGLVEEDGSWGVHNPKHTERLLYRAQSIAFEHMAADDPDDDDDDDEGGDQ